MSYKTSSEKSISYDTLQGRFAQLIRSTSQYRHRVLETLYNRQTLSERENRITCDLNHQGFTAPDAPTLTRLAEKIRGGHVLERSDDKMLKARLPKYWQQFVTLVELDAAKPHRRMPARATNRNRKGWVA
jgi:hypothetical protein